MTQQEIVRQFKGFSTAEQMVLISRLFRVMQERMEGKNSIEELKRSEKIAAIERLRGIAKTENSLITKEETKEDYYNYLAEKYL